MSKKHRADCYAALRPWYPADEYEVAEIEDPLQVLGYLDSKMSMCRGCGVPVGDTEFYVLAKPSKRAQDPRRPVLVCRGDLVDKLNRKHPFCDTTARDAIRMVNNAWGLHNDDRIEDLGRMIRVLREMRSNAGFNWITGTAALQLLLVLDGADPETTFTT